MKSKKTFNSKEAKFTQELSIYNSGCLNNTFKYALRRCITSKKFFEGLDKQLPNQLLYNIEEKETYFLNSDRQLFKLKFEPVIMKKKKQTQTVEEYTQELKTAYLKDEIQNLAIPWSKFNVLNAARVSKNYDLSLLTSMFVDLLDLVKEKEITIQCGVGMMQLLSFHPQVYYKTVNFVRTSVIEVGGCEIKVELNFNLGKYDLIYNDVTLVGQNLVEKQEPEKAETKKKILGIF
jgi:hypothetical protein